MHQMLSEKFDTFFLSLINELLYISQKQNKTKQNKKKPALKDRVV